MGNGNVMQPTAKLPRLIDPRLLTMLPRAGTGAPVSAEPPVSGVMPGITGLGRAAMSGLQSTLMDPRSWNGGLSEYDQEDRAAAGTGGGFTYNPASVDVQLPDDLESQPPTAEPRVMAPAPDELEPYMQRVRRSSDALQAEYEHAAGMEIPQPSIKRTLLGWLAGQAVPQLGQQITQGPNIQYERGMQASKMRMGALENAARIAERDLQLAQQRQLQKAQIGWYDRRVSPTEGRTIDVMHGDQAHTHQFNPETGQYDIEAGAPVERPSAHAMNEEELFLKDPAAYERFVTMRDRSRARSGRSGSEGSYIPLTDDEGEVTGAWNPKLNRYVEAPGPGLHRGGKQRDATGDFLKAQAQAVRNLSGNFRYKYAPPETQQQMLETETKRILDGMNAAAERTRSQSRGNGRRPRRDPLRLYTGSD